MAAYLQNGGNDYRQEDRETDRRHKRQRTDILSDTTQTRRQRARLQTEKTEELIQATFSSSHLIGCLSSEQRERLQAGRQRNGQTAQKTDILSDTITDRKDGGTDTGYFLILSPYWLPIIRTEGTITDRKTDGGTDTGISQYRPLPNTFHMIARLSSGKECNDRKTNGTSTDRKTDGGTDTGISQ